MEKKLELKTLQTTHKLVHHDSALFQWNFNQCLGWAKIF